MDIGRIDLGTGDTRDKHLSRGGLLRNGRNTRLSDEVLRVRTSGREAETKRRGAGTLDEPCGYAAGHHRRQSSPG